MSTNELWDSNPFVQHGFVQFLQEATVSVQMRRTDSYQLSRRIGDKVSKYLLSVMAVVAAGRFMVLTAEKGDHRLRLNDYKISTANLERNASEQKDIVKVVTVSVKQLEKKLCSL